MNNEILSLFFCCVTFYSDGFIVPFTTRDRLKEGKIIDTESYTISLQ